VVEGCLAGLVAGLSCSASTDADASNEPGLLSEHSLQLYPAFYYVSFWDSAFGALLASMKSGKSPPFCDACRLLLSISVVSWREGPCCFFACACVSVGRTEVMK